MDTDKNRILSPAGDSISVPRIRVHPCSSVVKPAARTSPRFTIDGSDELEQHLARACEQVRTEVLALVSARRLEAILLGGGYGRGEGGVLKTETGDRPYNDLEVYICLSGSQLLNERRYSAALHTLAQKLSTAVGVDVEFKLVSLRKLRRSPVSMFYYDLVMGHRGLWGTEDLLAGCAHHCVAEHIPLAEATRLLMNRCSGLLFAQEQLQCEPFTPVNADFIGRNLAKAQLALGDVLLVVGGRYHWSCRERAQRLRQAGASVDAADFVLLEDVKTHHLAGMEFKLHPQRTTASSSSLQKLHEELSGLALHVWLWLESRRLNCAFHTVRNYALSPVPKCPETKHWRNCLINLRTFGPGILFSGQATRYPRERLLEALSLLLWEPETLKSKALLQRVQRALRTSGETFPALLEAYRSLWHRFN